MPRFYCAVIRCFKASNQFSATTMGAGSDVRVIAFRFDAILNSSYHFGIYFLPLFLPKNCGRVYMAVDGNGRCLGINC